MYVRIGFMKNIEDQKTAVSEYLDESLEDGIMTFNVILDLE